MTSYGHSAKKLTSEGAFIHVYYYDHGEPTLFITFQPKYEPSDGWQDDWSLEVLNGDETVATSPDPRATVLLEDITADAVSVVVTNSSGFSRTEPVTEQVVYAYQDVEGYEHSPFVPDFSEMSDPELIEWAKRDDSHLSLGDIRVAADYVDKGYLKEERVITLVEYWFGNRGE